MSYKTDTLAAVAAAAATYHTKRKTQNEDDREYHNDSSTPTISSHHDDGQQRSSKRRRVGGKFRASQRQPNDDDSINIVDLTIATDDNGDDNQTEKENLNPSPTNDDDDSEVEITAVVTPLPSQKQKQQRERQAQQGRTTDSPTSFPSAAAGSSWQKPSNNGSSPTASFTSAGSWQKPSNAAHEYDTTTTGYGTHHYGYQSQHHHLLQHQHQQQRVPFGTFQGMDIYRNKIVADQEFWTDGHYSLEELILPGCSHAVMTTFGCGSPSYLANLFGSIPNLLIVNRVPKYWKTASVAGASPITIGNGLLFPIGDGRQPGWRFLFTEPHTGGCLHSKLYIFRSSAGLRLVVSGNNLNWHQQTRQRDVFWVQDFPAPVGVQDPYKELHHPHFEVQLRTFLIQLTSCSAKSPEEQTWVHHHLDEVLGGIDFNSHKAELVVSFPRPSSSPTTTNNNAATGDTTVLSSSSGGYKELAEAVDVLMTKNGYPLERDPNSILYATSGSLGNLEPDFVWRMYQAMNGIDSSKRKIAWKDQVDDVFRCMWPSKALASQMDYWGLRCGIRHMPTQHVESTIPRCSQLKMFHDAIPNPPSKIFPLRRQRQRRQRRCQQHHNNHNTNLPSGWEAATVLSSSRNGNNTKVYYYHRETRTSQWEKPNKKPDENLSPNNEEKNPRDDSRDDDNNTNNKKYWVTTHGKFMYNTCGVLYVGSHNFSQTAWGIRNAMPKNIEIGVVLVSRDKKQQESWRQRLPCHLVSPTVVSPSTYEIYRGGPGRLHHRKRHGHDNKNENENDTTTMNSSTNKRSLNEEKEEVIVCLSDDDDDDDDVIAVEARMMMDVGYY